MPDPCFATRREFLSGGLTLLSAGVTVPAFLERTALALDKRRPERDQRVLVVLQLAGGNDGLNTVIPVRDDAYYQARPQLAIARNEALRLTDDLGLHPQAAGLKQLFDEGLMAVVQGVGYPNPSRSHFVSTEIWETADPDGREHRGWLGRYFDCMCEGPDRPDPRQAIALTQEAPQSLIGERFSPVAFVTPDQLDWRPGLHGPEARATRLAREAFEQLNRPPGDDADPSRAVPGPAGRDRPGDRPARSGARRRANDEEPLTPLEYLQRAALDARVGSREIQEAAGGRRDRGAAMAGGGGRHRLGAQLRMVARMIAADLPTRVYYVSLSGFDTHAGQAGRHGQLLNELGDSLVEFFEALRGGGGLDRVLVMTFSEFGRRVEQNASQGTDHGSAAPMFLFGPAARAGLHGRHPDLRSLYRGDLAWHVDFRSVYAAVLSRWLEQDARRIIGGGVRPINVLR